MADSTNVSPIPAGYHSVTPYLIVDGANEAIEFYRQAFHADELLRMPTPEGKIMHAEIKIGDSHVMLSDEAPDMGYRCPPALGGSPVSLHIYLADVDATFSQAIAAGATEVRPVDDQFYGDRSGTLRDPFGHVWTISTHIEDVTPEEIQRRASAMSTNQESSNS